MVLFSSTPLPVIAVVFSPLAVHQHLMKRILLAVCRRHTSVRPAGLRLPPPSVLGLLGAPRDFPVLLQVEWLICLLYTST
jgi:hypothetical protein